VAVWFAENVIEPREAKLAKLRQRYDELERRRDELERRL
jgi:hypothetical protein